MIATAVALTPVAPGAVDIATVGVVVYPLPSFVKNNSLTYPVGCERTAVAAAVVPALTIFNVVINPSS